MRLGDLIEKSLASGDKEAALEVLREIRRAGGDLDPNDGDVQRLVRARLVCDAFVGSNAVNDPYCWDLVRQVYQRPMPGDGAFRFEVPTGFLDVPQPPAIVPGGANTQRVVFTGCGNSLAIGLLGSVRDNATGLDAQLGSTGVRISINEGSKNGATLNTSGTGASFTPYASLFRCTSPYFPFMRFFDSRDTMDIRWTSFVAGGGILIIPCMTFCFGTLF